MKKKKVKVEYTLLLDLRSSSIGYGLIDGNFNIIQSKRNHFYLRDIDKIEDYMKLFYQTIDEILDSFRKENHQKFESLKKIEVSLSSPWYKVNLKNFSINDGKNKKIIKKYFNDLINSDATNNAGPKSEIIEKKIMDILINGYSVKNPIGKKYNRLGFSIYISSIEKNIKKNIERHIKKSLNKKITSFNTHPLIAYTNLNSFEKEVEDFMIVDVSGEITDIYISQASNLTQTISIPFGTHFIVRSMVRDLKLDNHTAFSKLELLNNKHANELKDSEVKILDKFKEEWLDRIKNSLIKNKVENTPNSIFVFSDNNTNDLLVDILNDAESYSKYLMNNIKPQIVSINSFKNEFIEQKNNLNQDNAIILLTEYLKMHEN